MIWDNVAVFESPAEACDLKPREIFLTALRRGQVPRPATGSATSIVTADLMAKVGVHFPEAHLDARKMSQLAAAGYTELGFDNVMPLFSTWHDAAALGCKVDWGDDHRMPDSRERLYRVGDDIRIPRGFLRKPSCKVALDTLRMLKEEHGAEVAIVGKVFGPWTLGYHLFGVEEFLINTLDNPSAVRKAMSVLKEATVMFGKAQIEAGADALCLADHATRDLCSPAAYRDFLFEIHQEINARLGCPVILHICGDTSDRIGYIRETGIACFHFDSKTGAPRRAQRAQRTANGSNGEDGDDSGITASATTTAGEPLPTDAASLARQLAGDRLALMGGTSNLLIIKDGTEEAIRNDVREKIAAGTDIIGPECAVPLNAPWRNMKILTAEARRAQRTAPPA